MKMSEINKVFTEKVAEYMARGYVINPVSMSGSQGEVGKVDLVKGEDLIRVWMEEVTGKWNDPTGFTGNHICVCVGRWTRPASDASRFATIWYNEIEVIEGIRFYEINREKWYVDSLEEALRLQEVTHSRRSRRGPVCPTYTYITDPQRIEIARNFLKRKHHYKRVSTQNIELRQSPYGGTYVITYNGHDFFLSAK